MIKRTKFERQPNPYALVEDILLAHKDYFLTKEEILREIPVDEDGVIVITISALENALRTLAHSRVIIAERYKNSTVYAINERREY